MQSLTSLSTRLVPPSADTDGHEDEDRFIAILAHELRNPLGPIKNAAALLKSSTLDPMTTRRTCEIIDRQVGEMNHLIDDLLDASRLKLGNLQLRRSRATVSEIVERTVETMRPFVAARGHALLVSAPPEPIILDADAMRLSQALQNIIGNAVKYTNPGGQIRLDVRRDGNEAVVTVSDTGIGIAPTQLEAIFELYVQAGQSATERSAGGLGIGLYLARRLVEEHGGTIRASSAGPGRGSEFVVRLPCNEVFDGH